jgi:hypothetical protein
VYTGRDAVASSVAAIDAPSEALAKTQSGPVGMKLAQMVHMADADPGKR